ncbi:hypothetical protein ISF9_089 [Microbacterium phage vB_MoxS-ISF9]|uniref:Uncharacterized protein n=1 Tax=Microbacterium phage vB_MoxS-ISF9 TaxID=1458670 RepID=W8NP10_9CAUD|nr:hypothetical protein ISF9_089 [Microbacterium phage vB_MoxS-ISF9]AHL18559.1 hypothetical protein ISF9_089 [Microbacterium phage vB_MoxS-ISF9]
MSDVLDLGEVEIPGWRSLMSSQQAVPFREVESRHGIRAAYIIHDINHVRSWIRRRRYGEADGPACVYRVLVKWPGGEEAVWEFDHTVGWPRENGQERDWHAEWMKNFGGVA